MHRVVVTSFLLLAACPMKHAPQRDAVQQIAAGNSPGSNTHQWGTRWFEVRGAGARREVRVHDVIEFQGSGMQPQDMDPPRHRCTEWQALPQEVEVPAVRSCDATPDACKPLEQWLRAAALSAGEAPCM